MLLCNRDKITLHDLPEMLAKHISPDPLKTVGPAVLPMQDGWDALLKQPWRQVRRTILDRMEREYLDRLLKSTGGHIGRTAKRAGMQPRSLFDKMKKHGLRKEDFKPEDSTF